MSENPTTTEKEIRKALAWSIGTKSVIIAYILWFFLGSFGVHRMYLDKVPSGVMMALLTIVGGATAPFIIGIPLLIAVFIWWVYDGFMIFFAARKHNQIHDVIANS